MEGELSGLDIHTPVFDKKKKKYSVDKERHRMHAHASFRDAPLASEHSHKTKKGKKRKDHQHLASSPLKTSELCEEAAEAPSPAKKRKKKSALGIQDGTGVYVMVDKENIENMPKNFRRDVDIVYIDMSREQESPREPEADESPAVTKRWEEPRSKVREKKKKKRRREAASCDAALGGPGSGASVLPQPESPLSAGLGGPVTQLPGAAHEKKPEKRKRKISHHQGCESPEAVNSEGTQVAHGPGTAEGRREPCRLKKRAKKRRQRVPVESAVSGLPTSLEDPLLDSLGGNASSIEESATPRPREEEDQACSEEALSDMGEPTSGGAGNEAAMLQGYGSFYKCTPFSPSFLPASAQVPLTSWPGSKRLAVTPDQVNPEHLLFLPPQILGVTIKFGKFSAKENEQLEKNVQEFLSLTGIENADKLLYTDRYPEEKAAITNLKRKYAFRLHIGKGIARPWKLVYYRAKKMFDVNNYKGRYSNGDAEKLKMYHSLHGNDWKKIGGLVARSSLSVALKFSQISCERNHGAWSKTETQRLIKAVEEVILKTMSPQDLEEVDSRLQENPEGCLSIVREKLYKGISWVEVEAKVETRNWMQCKSKWTEILTKRMTNGRDVYRGVNALQAKINLIERLYEINVEDANEIDWEDLAGTIG
uniref:Myb-like domain-containing protein n=1 Tax=Myotis lucifugus TaxID=59463 RepID=G1PY79_MYOLU